MISFKNALLGMLASAVVVCAADYSEMTRTAFMQDCTREASEKECLCVLDKMQNQYSEKAFQNYYAGMRNGTGNENFITFMVSAATGCVLLSDDAGGLVGGSPEQMSEEDMKVLFNAIRNEFPKKEFVQSCAPELKEVFGEKVAEDVCNCAYERMVTDFDLFVKMVKEEGAQPGSIKNSESFQLMLIGLATKCLSELK